MHAFGRSERLQRRARVARWFVAAVADTETTLKGVAKCVGVDEKKVHNVARANHGLTFDLALALPDELFDRVVGELARARGRALYTPHRSGEDAVNAADRLLVTKDALTEPLVRCTRKQAVSPDDAAELKPKLRRMQEDAQLLLDLCDEAETNRGVLLRDDEP